MVSGGCMEDYYDMIEDELNFVEDYEDEEEEVAPQNTHLYFDDDGRTITRDEFLVANTRPWQIEIPWAPGVTITDVAEFTALLKFMEEHDNCARVCDKVLRLGLTKSRVQEILEHPSIRQKPNFADINYCIGIFA